MQDRHTPSLAIGAKGGRIRRIIVMIAFGLLLAVAAFMVPLFFFGAQHVVVPPTVVQQAKSPLYIPKKLPGNYAIEQKSFSVQEESVVTFWAVDDTGGKITFTEQARPKDMEFDDFYAMQFDTPTTLSDVPFTSVTGKTLDQRSVVLSIVTPDTWVMVSTRSPLDKDGMALIAKSITRY